MKLSKYLNHFYFSLAVERYVYYPLWSAWNYIFAYWWNVHIGKRCKFRGRAYFYRLPESKITIGDGCMFLSSNASNKIGVYSPCMISCVGVGANLTIGNGCGFSGTVIGCGTKIEIGHNVRCGANTLITDTDWHRDDYRTKEDRPIKIEDNVWLGYGVKVFKGVHIGENSFVGACTIVTHDIPANVVVAGNPARIIRKIENAN